MNLRSRARVISSFFFIIIMLIVVDSVYAEDLIVSTDKFSYGLGATVTIQGRLTWQGSPVVNGLVAVQVDDVAGGLRFIRVVTTGAPPSSWKVRIVQLQSCDYQGNPKNSFGKGNLAFFNLTIKNSDSVERRVTMALNLFDSVGVSFAVVYAKFSLASGQPFTYFGSIPIPTDAFVGTAMCCASVLSGLPDEDGYPYCPEEHAEFTITGTQIPGSSPASATGSGGSYSLTFKLPSSALLGNYSVYAGAYHNTLGNIVFVNARRAIFDSYWLKTDINRDGIVNILDMSMAARAFGSRIGDAKYSRFVDVVNDNVINILDISSVARDTGRVRLGY